MLNTCEEISTYRIKNETSILYFYHGQRLEELTADFIAFSNGIQDFWTLLVFLLDLIVSQERQAEVISTSRGRREKGLIGNRNVVKDPKGILL